MLLSFGLYDNMWREAMLSTCFVLNRVIYRKLDKTLYKLWKWYAMFIVSSRLRLSYMRYLYAK